MGLAKLKTLPLLQPIHTSIRAKLQERRARKTLEWAHRRLRETGRSIPTVEQVAAELRRRRASRRPGMQPRRPGELHVFVVYYISNWERILPESLRPFGRVTPFEWRGEGFDDRRDDWWQNRPKMNAALRAAFDRANRIAPVDAVVGYMSGRTIEPESVRHMTAGGAMVFNFCWDDKLWMPGPFVNGIDASPGLLAADVDLNLTNAPESVAKYAAFGGLAMFWPEAAHPEVHRPAATEFRYDVSFVGQRYGWRPEFVARLGRQGIRVACFGRGWPNGPLDDAEMVRLYSQSRINLGFGGVGYSKRLLCLKGRDFEVPMAGGLYLTQDNPELGLVYRVGTEIEVYRDLDDCGAKIRSLLREPDRAAAIRSAGRLRALADHTYLSRYSNLFNLAMITG